MEMWLRHSPKCQNSTNRPTNNRKDEYKPTRKRMIKRNGKIAHLPNDIREQLNLRLLEGEAGRELVEWLNALPAVQSVLASQFNGSPIWEVNLTHWRQGGYLQWLTERECFDSAYALAEADCDLAKTGLSAERTLIRFNLPSNSPTPNSAPCAVPKIPFVSSCLRAFV
jgi:hypothetical protein